MAKLALRLTLRELVFRAESAFPFGERTRLACWRRRLRRRELAVHRANPILVKMLFGGSPKRARDSRALPEMNRAFSAEGLIYDTDPRRGELTMKSAVGAKQIQRSNAGLPETVPLPRRRVGP